MRLTRCMTGAVLSAAMVMGAGWAPGEAAAEYPEKPVNFIVPWPPGDLEDVLTRMIAEDFQQEYGVAAAVVNKPGGGGGPFPGAIEVANAPSDGYTIGSFVIGVPVMGHQIEIPPLTPAKFDPLGIFLTYPFVIATSGDAPYATMEELAAYAQDNDVALGHFGMSSLRPKLPRPMPKTRVLSGVLTRRLMHWIAIRWLLATQMSSTRLCS